MPNPTSPTIQTVRTLNVLATILLIVRNRSVIHIKAAAMEKILTISFIIPLRNPFLILHTANRRIIIIKTIFKSICKLTFIAFLTLETQGYRTFGVFSYLPFISGIFSYCYFNSIVSMESEVTSIYLYVVDVGIRAYTALSKNPEYFSTPFLLKT